MRIRAGLITKSIALFLAAGITALSLSGCQYESFDDYLQAVGIKAPDFDEETPEESPELTFEGLTEEEQVPDEEGLPDQSEIPAKELATDLPSEEEAVESTYQADEPSALDSSFDAGDNEKRAAIGLSPSSIPALKEKQKGLYAFEKLTDTGKTLYVEMLTIIENLGEDICVSTTNSDDLELVYNYIMIDHPEIFYVDGYQYKNYTLGSTVTKMTFTGNYLYGADEIARRQRLINDAVNKCLANAPSSEDDYYVIKYIYDYIITNTDYDLNAPDNQNICSVFINGRSVCSGYAKATQYLLNKLGIETVFVYGQVRNNSGIKENHAWNLVLCNDAYYYLDTTLGDFSYRSTTGESADASKLPKVNYSYMNITTAELIKSHDITDEIEMPLCSSTTDNYFIREGEYFTSAELSLVKDLFDRRYKEGADSVTIKCATPQVYTELFDQLITGRKVFDYMQGEDNSTVTYTVFEDMQLIMIWL